MSHAFKGLGPASQGCAMALVLGLSAGPAQASATSDGLADLAKLWSPARAARTTRLNHPWLGGTQSSLQASLGGDGFWDSQSSIEPPTGREARRRGSALLALGLLRSATSILHVVLGSASRCGPDKGLDWSEQSCSNLRLYGYLGMGLSAAFLAGGSIELGRGLMQKRRHDRWKQTHWDHFSSHFSLGGLGEQAAQLRPRLR